MVVLSEALSPTRISFAAMTFIAPAPESVSEPVLSSVTLFAAFRLIVPLAAMALLIVMSFVVISIVEAVTSPLNVVPVPVVCVSALLILTVPPNVASPASVIVTFTRPLASAWFERFPYTFPMLRSPEPSVSVSVFPPPPVAPRRSPRKVTFPIPAAVLMVESPSTTTFPVRVTFPRVVKRSLARVILPLAFTIVRSISWAVPSVVFR